MSVLKVNNLSAVTGSTLITVPSDNFLYAKGHAVQTKTATSGPARQSITSLTPVAVDGLTISFTPLNANSRIVVKAQISTSATSVSAFAVYKNGVATVSTAGVTNSTAINMQFTSYIGADSNDYMLSYPLIWSEVAGSTVARTYQIYAMSAFGGGVRTLHINNRNSNDMAAFSHMTVMEIAQ
jgi:hypothetical protein